MKQTKKIWLIFFCILSLKVLGAETLNTYHVSEHIFQFTGGSAYAYHNYISELPYKGASFGLSYQGRKDLKNNLHQSWMVRTDGGFLKNPLKTRTSYHIKLHTNWALYKKFSPAKNLDIYTGGAVQCEGGGLLFYYMTGNNPGIVDFNTSLDFALLLDYGFQVNKQKFRVNYSMTLPLAGLRFAPPFGASYYEMFGLGSVDFANIFSLASFHNTFSIQHSLSLDIILKKSQLRLSYFGKSDVSHIKGIKNYFHAHGFSVGWVISMINLSGSKAKKPLD